MLNNKNGAKRYSLNKLVDRFYTSRFNRDNMHSLEKDEDIDNSRKRRIFNKQDIKEVVNLFFEFIEWAIIEENIYHIDLTNNLELIRDSELPKLKKATKVDANIRRRTVDNVVEGQWYITKGRYSWRMWITGDLYQRVQELWKKDPDRIKVVEDLTPEMEAKNSASKGTKKDN